MNLTDCLWPWCDSWAEAVEQYGMETASEAAGRYQNEHRIEQVSVN